MDVKDATGPLPIAFTFNASDSVAWRQWHDRNSIPGVIRVRLSAGKNVLTVHVVPGGNMNLAHFDSRRLDSEARVATVRLWGRAELKFTDSEDVIYLIYVDAKLLKLW